MKYFLTFSGTITITLFYTGLEVAIIQHLGLPGILVFTAFIFIAWAVSVWMLFYAIQHPAE